MAITERPIFLGDSGDYHTDLLAGFPADGSTDERSALSTLLTSTMPATGGRVILGLGTHLIGSSITIDRQLIIPEGAKLKPASGATITLSHEPLAGRYQIFDVSAGGIVAFDSDTPVAPKVEWWGADPSGSTDSNAAIQAAIDAAGAQGVEVDAFMGNLPHVDIGPGRFSVSGLTLTKPIALRGAGRLSTIITSTTNAPIITYQLADTIATWDMSMAPLVRDLEILGGGDALTSQVGIRLSAGAKRGWVHLEGVGITRCGSHGFSSDTAVSNRLDGCLIVNNYGSGIHLEGSFNTDVHITRCLIRRNRIGIECAGGNLYTLWASHCLIENNTQGSGAPGSNTRPCVGVAFTGGSYRQAVFANCYFEGHLNDIWAPSTTPVRKLTLRSNLHAMRAKALDILAFGTPERQFGAVWLGSNSNDSFLMDDCYVSQPIKPAEASDAEWGTFNVARTTTGSITNGSNVLTVASVTGIRPGSLLSIDGVSGYFTVVAVDSQFSTSTYRVELDGNADATVSDATVSIHWGEAYAHIPVLNGRSHVIQDSNDTDPATGRLVDIEVGAGPQFVTRINTAGSGDTPSLTIRGPSETLLSSWNRIRLNANEILSTSKRVVLASENCTVGTSGDSRMSLASVDSSAAGTRTIVGACENTQVDATNAVALASEHSTVDQDRTVMLASQRVAPVFGPTVVMGWASIESPTSTANRKLELRAATGDIYMSGTLTSSHTFSDWAKMFENLEPGVIPLGTIVALDGDKVRPWNGEEPLLGVVSATPAITTGDTPFSWRGRYQTGEFGEPLYDTVNGVTVYRENPEFDPSLPQVPRSERPEEWTRVGLLGEVHVRVGKDAAPGDVIGGRLTVMAITRDYDPDKGYAVAKCLLR